MMSNNPKLDLVNMIAYIKFGENMSSSSQDIEGKQNFYVNQGPSLGTNVQKMMSNNLNVDHVNINAHTKFG